MATTNVTPKALKFSERAAQLTANLWARWQDEKEYEDIKDYMQPYVRTAAECGVSLIAMQKRPFGVRYSVDGKEFLLYCNGRSVGYKRTK